MRKDEFLKQLEYLLQDIPDADKEEAVAYYRDYLEEAGSENEEQVIEEFGSPERVAAIIRADVTGNLRDGGSFTDKGYEDERFRDPNYQVAKRLDLPEEKENTQKENDYEGSSFEKSVYERASYEDAEYRECYDKTPESRASAKKDKKMRTGKVLKWTLWAILLIVASPFILGAVGIVLGTIGGVLAIILGTAVMILCLTAAAFVCSVCLGAFGIAFLATTPLDSVLLFGIAVVGIGCGILGAVLLYLVFGIGGPLLAKGCGKLIKFLSASGKEMKNA